MHPTPRCRSRPNAEANRSLRDLRRRRRHARLPGAGSCIGPRALARAGDPVKLACPFARSASSVVVASDCSGCGRRALRFEDHPRDLAVRALLVAAIPGVRRDCRRPEPLTLLGYGETCVDGPARGAGLQPAGDPGHDSPGIRARSVGWRRAAPCGSTDGCCAKPVSALAIFGSPDESMPIRRSAAVSGPGVFDGRCD